MGWRPFAGFVAFTAAIVTAAAAGWYELVTSVEHHLGAIELVVAYGSPAVLLLVAVYLWSSEARRRTRDRT